MKILNALLNSKEKEIKNIIHEELGSPFNTHQFIQNFTQKYQRDYIEHLNRVKDEKTPFQYLHGMIGTYLRDNEGKYEITKDKKVPITNIFGQESPRIQQWKRK